MDSSGPNLGGTSPEDIFKDFKARRAGILKALTTDVEKFFQECDPEKDNLCLYGHSDETWQVELPAEEVPAELPEPALGINFARDGMKRSDWLALVAVHSDAWLLSVSFFLAARCGFDKESRRKLFNLISDLPTMYQIVTGAPIENRKQPKERNSNGSSRVNRSAPKAGNPSKVSRPPPPTKEEEDVEDMDTGEGADEEEEEGEDEGQAGSTPCGACGESYGADEFWICCDACERWFHGKCVRITPARAEHIKHYKCPGCTNKRARA